MADTHGFEVVAEVLPAMLKQVLASAWKSGGDPGGGGVIPEYFNIPPGTMVGPYTLQDGQVQIPQAELDVTMAPDVNGVDLKFGLHFQVDIQNPPVPSVGMLTMTADCHAKAPVGTLPGTVNVGILLAGLPRSAVTATLTSGDPITPNLDTYLSEYVHQKYVDDGPAFPHTVTKTGQPVGAFGVNAYTVDVLVELFDDPSDPTRQIQVTRPPGQVQISIPIHMRIYNIFNNLLGLAPTLLDPMGIVARMVLTAPLVQSPGMIQAQLTAATVTTVGLAPAPGIEGTNFTSNDAALSGQVTTNITSQLQTQGQQMAMAMGDIVINVPSVTDIETAIGDAFYQELTAQGSLAVWTPDTGAGAPVQVNDVTTFAAADMLAIAINAGGGADATALTNFVPGTGTFAIAISAAKVLGIIDTSIHRPESEGGFGPGFPPKEFDNVNGHKAKLTRLDISLTTAIHMEGDVTVINAILGSIDVDTSFTEDVGLHWEDNMDGTQQMKSDPGSPDVDLSVLAWIVSFLIGFITLGLVGGIIALVVMMIVQGVAQSIGSTLIVNNVTNQVEGIGAWPSQLVKIGTVQAKFVNPIVIAPDGIVVAG
jgi:hypothetical protein